MMRRHAELLCEHMGEERGCKEFRKHVSWYLKGFAAGGTLRHSLALVDSLAASTRCSPELDPAEPFPVSELGTPARPAGLAAGQGRPPRGMARRRRRRGRARPGGEREPRAGRAGPTWPVLGNTPAEPGGRLGLAPGSVLDSRLRVRFVINYPSREAAVPLTSTSKGSALWQIIATSGTPMPAASRSSRRATSSRPDSPSWRPPRWSPSESSGPGPSPATWSRRRPAGPRCRPRCRRRRT